MRVSPVGHAYGTEREVLEQAALTAACTHNHPEGVKGAQVVALAVFMARNGASKDAIRAVIAERFGYDLSRKLADIRLAYRINLTCPGSVPEAIIAFLESDGFEDAIRNAVSLGGDADTQAAIAGAIAEAFYGKIPEQILFGVRKRMNRRFIDVVLRFYDRFGTENMIAQAHILDGQT